MQVTQDDNAKVTPRLLRRSEAADYLAICERRVWVLTNRGEIGHVKIGRSIRYRPEDLEAYIDRQLQEARR